MTLYQLHAAAMSRYVAMIYIMVFICNFILSYFVNIISISSKIWLLYQLQDIFCLVT